MKGLKRWKPTPGEQYLRDRGDLRDGEKHKDFVQERVLERESATRWVRSEEVWHVKAGRQEIADLILREAAAQWDDAGLTPLQKAILTERVLGASLSQAAATRGITKQGAESAERFGRKKLNHPRRGGMRLDIAQTYLELVHRPRYHRSCGRVRLAA